MGNVKRVAKSISVMVLLGIGSKALGFIREILIAAKFGAGIETDTFFIALTATGLFTSMFTQALNITMIPVLSDVEKGGGKDAKRRFTNNLFNILVVISIVFVILGWIFSSTIIKMLAHGFEGEQFLLAVTLMQLGMPVIIFAGIVGIYRGFLQSESMFIESSISDFPYNLTYIFFLIFLSSYLGIKGMMVTNVLAVFSQILIQISSLKKLGYKYEFRIDIKDPYITKILFLVVPVLISVVVNDLNKIVDRTMASTLVKGSISALNYSARLDTLVLAIFITAIATVFFPILSKEALNNSCDGFKKLIKSGINIVLLLTIPTTIGMIVLAEPIVEITLERGAFGTVATQMTSQALVFYTLGLVSVSVRTYLERVFYALQDTRTPMINGFITVTLNVLLDIILIGPLKHMGLALATSVATTITTVYMFCALRKKIGKLDISSILKCGVKSFVSSLFMGGIVYVVYYSFIGKFMGSTMAQLGVLFLSVGVGAGVYLISIYILKVDEMIWFIHLIKRKIWR